MLQTALRRRFITRGPGRRPPILATPAAAKSCKATGWRRPRRPRNVPGLEPREVRVGRRPSAASTATRAGGRGRRKGWRKWPRLLSEGAGALKGTVDASLDRPRHRGEPGLRGHGPDAPRRGPHGGRGGRVQGARRAADQGGAQDAAGPGLPANSHAMQTLNVEHILLVWLNFALSDPVLKERILDFVYASCVQKSRERLSLTSPTARRWAHCLWGAFGQRRARVSSGCSTRCGRWAPVARSCCRASTRRSAPAG